MNQRLNFSCFFNALILNNTTFSRLDAVNILLLGNTAEKLLVPISSQSITGYINGKRKIGRKYIQDVLSLTSEEIHSRIEKLKLTSLADNCQFFLEFIKRVNALDDQALQQLTQMANENDFESFAATSFVRALECPNSQSFPFPRDIISLLQNEIGYNYNELLEQLDTIAPSQENQPGNTLTNQSRIIGKDESNISTLNRLIPEKDYDKNITVLNDPDFWGRYYGAFYSPNPTSNEIILFELDIEHKDNHVSATMTYHGHPRRGEKAEREDLRITYGVPFLDQHNSNIFMQLTNNKGDFYYLTYPRPTFRSHSMYYNKGVAITASSIGTHSPMTMNFILVTKPLNNVNTNYLRGYLSDANPIFLLADRDVSTLAEENQVIRTFFTEYDSAISMGHKMYYTIDENQILSTQKHTNMSMNETVSALLLLKAKSLSPARIEYIYSLPFANFSQDVLLTDHEDNQ